MGLLDSVSRLHQGLDYHLARHNLLVSNLAHLDTPGYKPLDLQRPNAGFHEAMTVALAETSAQHLGGHATPEPWKTVVDPGATAGADGNGVSVDREASKIAMNQVRYDALASLVGGELSGLAWAANDGRGA
jgi:flagellar basal-body rod protein FlgB